MSVDKNLKNPLISVIIPTYNGTDALSRAILSVINQTYSNFELIIIDDCSTDNTEMVVRTFKDDRIIYIRHSQNKGTAAARNMGISKAKGTLLAFLDSDDEFLPEKLEKQSEVFQFVSEDTGLIITNLCSLGKRKEFYVSKKIKSGYVLPSSFPGSVFSLPSTWMLRKNCADQVGLFDEMTVVIEDADYFVRILGKFRIYYLNRALSIKHASLERKGHFSNKYFLSKEHFLKKHFAKMRKDRRYLSRFYYGIGKDFLNWNKPSKAKRYLLKAFVTFPKLSYLFKYLKCFLSKIK